ncbi:MAG: hypothetical protein ACFE8L_07290 [Candidatus Hodarchaeota archaeon]
MARNELEVLEEVEFIVIENSDNKDQKDLGFFLYLIILFIIKYSIILFIYSF